MEAHPAARPRDRRPLTSGSRPRPQRTAPRRRIQPATHDAPGEGTAPRARRRDADGQPTPVLGNGRRARRRGASQVPPPSRGGSTPPGAAAWSARAVRPPCLGNAAETMFSTGGKEAVHPLAGRTPHTEGVPAPLVTRCSPTRGNGRRSPRHCWGRVEPRPDPGGSGPRPHYAVRAGRPDATDPVPLRRAGVTSPRRTGSQPFRRPRKWSRRCTRGRCCARSRPSGRRPRRTGACPGRP